LYVHAFRLWTFELKVYGINSFHNWWEQSRLVATFLFGGNSLARTRSTDDSLGSSRHDNSIEQDFESKPHLSDSFLDGQDFTHLFSYHTPSGDSLHTLTNHSTSRKLAVNFNIINSRLSFDQTTKQCFGTYKFLRLPIGLKTAPNTFQLLMDKVLHGLKFKSCLYLDDVLICSETFEHMSALKEVFRRVCISIEK
jgi:hypothetical protein